MVSEQLHYTTNREEIFIFSNKKMSYLCGVWRFANAYYTFRKQGCMPVTIPKHEPIKKVYVEMVRQIVESEAKNDEDAE